MRDGELKVIKIVYVGRFDLALGLMGSGVAFGIFAAFLFAVSQQELAALVCAGFALLTFIAAHLLHSAFSNDVPFEGLSAFYEEQRKHAQSAN